MLSGCMYLSPAQTTKSYDPADGTQTTMGSLQFSDLLVVTTKKGAPGRVHGMVTNDSDSPVKLSVGKQTVTIPGQTAVRLDGKPSGNNTKTIPAVKLAKVPVHPGKRMSLTFTTAKAGANTFRVPVQLDQGYYGTANPTHPTYNAPSSTKKTEPDG